jgi:hypothetical protein
MLSENTIVGRRRTNFVPIASEVRGVQRGHTGAGGGENSGAKFLLSTMTARLIGSRLSADCSLADHHRLATDPNLFENSDAA